MSASLSFTPTATLGPLTTIFTPPTQCLSTITYSPGLTIVYPTGKSSTSAVLYSQLYLGATGVAPDLACYPPNYHTEQIYSPGICPSGWFTACGTNIGSTTVQQCCPSGFGCHGTKCTQSPASTARAVWSLVHNPFLSGVLTSTNFPTIGVAARPIFVAFESKDQSILTAATRSTSSDGHGSHTSQSQSSGASQSDEKSKTSLSGGEIAGIVIGALCGGILITCPLVFLLLRFCLGYRKIPSNDHAMDGNTVQPLYSGQPVNGQQAQHLVQPMQQWPEPPKELPVGHPRAELEGRSNRGG